MSTGSIFISYRRDDSIASAGRLYDHLRDRFGDVFMDVDAIDPGDDFVEVVLDSSQKFGVNPLPAAR